MLSGGEYMAVHRPSLGEKLFFLLSGAVISTPFPAMANTLISYFLLLNYSRDTAVLVSVALFAPLIEEFAKAYPLFYRHGETEKSLLSLGFLTGLGFGIAEFFLYVFILDVNFLIRLPLILFHASSASITACGIGQNRAFLFYFLAVILHATVNIGAFLQGSWMIAAILAIVVAYTLALFLNAISRQKTVGNHFDTPSVSH